MSATLLPDDALLNSLQCQARQRHRTARVSSTMTSTSTIWLLLRQLLEDYKSQGGDNVAYH